MKAISVCDALQKLQSNSTVSNTTVSGRTVTIDNEIILADMACDDVIFGRERDWPTGLVLKFDPNIFNPSEARLRVRSNVKACSGLSEPIATVNGKMHAASEYKLRAAGGYVGSAFGPRGLLPGIFVVTKIQLGCRPIRLVEFCTIFDDVQSFEGQTIAVRAQFWDDWGGHGPPFLIGPCSLPAMTSWVETPRILAAEESSTLGEAIYFDTNTVLGVVRRPSSKQVRDALLRSEHPDRTVIEGLFVGAVIPEKSSGPPMACLDSNSDDVGLGWLGTFHIESIWDGEVRALEETEANSIWAKQESLIKCVTPQNK